MCLIAAMFCTYSWGTFEVWSIFYVYKQYLLKIIRSLNSLIDRDSYIFVSSWCDNNHRHLHSYYIFRRKKRRGESVEFAAINVTKFVYCNSYNSNITC